ncbi:MAG: hypothetical protein IM583_17850 [Pseudanabaena sp. M114S2SP2A07QC]|nr:hypothetical protein [Pseudanabaena sp. M090S1SP2A07QC]MCA6507657.1 hypothetical protein [Pseudanabaena sp. M172S2SP2A07QC]MCA6520640.1 hypothetical protein [Pseudanabaena sp. M051S1SP2A07QC]MCA6526639.1 hypothetical protein [Pseudanabaena sp. M179S2SP2A07QC]MCA6532706.1 hypothetical protein [Pseudanabaena sp. M176S2SP2A07QC]MCA6538726.1 hypothetical protein [Pseudanabaena sp. M037S2SP2A07QC]MCA6558424.1 hypothetical protein [Pseudanabaena sp. M114S2SP2A07QC]MCA6559925.1 hypothetical prot
MAERSSAIFWVLCPKQSLHCYRTYAKERAVGAIHELPLRQNDAFRAFLRKSKYKWGAKHPIYICRTNKTHKSAAMQYFYGFCWFGLKRQVL